MLIIFSHFKNQNFATRPPPLIYKYIKTVLYSTESRLKGDMSCMHFFFIVLFFAVNLYMNMSRCIGSIKYNTQKMLL